MTFKTFVLLVFITAFGVFIYISVKVRGDESTSFNQTTRFVIGKYSWARNIFGLHKDGDARGWYLTSKSRLVLEVVVPDNVPRSENIFEQFKNKLSKLMGRPVDLVMVDSIQSGILSKKNLEEIVDTKKRHAYPGDGGLFVVLSEDYQGRENNELGRTCVEDGILLSHSALKELSSGSTRLYERYLITTLLHEFGHQLGLPHTDETECIMQPHASYYMRARDDWYTESVSDEYCGKELESIKNIKEKLQ